MDGNVAQNRVVGSGWNGKPPLFIVGCPRSGTQLTARLLKPTAYGVPFESHFIIKYYKNLSRYGDLNQYKNFSRLVKDIVNHWAVSMWNIQINAHDLFTTMTERTYPNIVNVLCSHIAKHTSPAAQTWGDKTPFYALELETLLDIFPYAKVLYITRDGRDVAMSLLQQSWGPKNIYSCGKLWKKHIETKERFHSLEKQGQLYNIKYESLLDDPETIMSGVYNFINQEYQTQEMSKLISTIKDNNSNKWKTQLSNAEIACFESVAGSALAREGYPLASQMPPPLSRGWAMYYTLQNTFGQALQLFRGNTLGMLQIKLLHKKPFEVFG